MKITKPKIMSQFKTWLNKIEESDLKIKLISFSIALLLHLALILYLRQAKILINILPFGRETDVVIATYPKLSLPANLEEVINQPPAADDLFSSRPGLRPVTGRPGKAGGLGAGGGPGPGAGAGAEAAGGPGREAGKATAQSSIPFNLGAYLEAGRTEINPPSGVRLNLSTRFRSFGHYYFSLKLPVAPEGEKETGGLEASPPIRADLFGYANPKAYEQPGKNLRFTPAGRPVLPGGGGPGGGSGGSGRGATGGGGGGYDYDIRPWAEKIINLIQARWVLPQLAVFPKEKIVALMIRVDRSGELQSLEVTTSTTSEVLDGAAVAAVKLSAPFPSLPDDFPGKSLEFYLIFTYHD
jgi:TonB family protein